MAKIEKTSNFTIAKPTMWEAETPMRQFELAIDALEMIAGGITEDRAASNAVASVHGTLIQVYAELHGMVFEDVQ